MRDLTGATLGSYELKELVGKGAMAFVYRAVQRPLGREVALKILAPSLVEQPGFPERFEHEAQTLSRLDCPNILPVFDYSRIDGVTFLVMPYVGGGNLRTRLDDNDLDRDQVGRVLTEIGEALHYAHEAGIIHRDVKPSNILIHPDGRPVLADFGLARNDTTPAVFTAHGFTLGTPGYMAPEQAMGRALDRRADVYSLGVLAFEMLTGAVPYLGESPMETMVATVRDPIPSARAVNPSLPEAVDVVLARVLAKDPEDRYPTARDFLTGLAGISFAPDWRPAPRSRSTDTHPTAVLRPLTEEQVAPVLEPESVARVTRSGPRVLRRWLAIGGRELGPGRYLGAAALALVLGGVLLVWRQGVSGSELAIILAALAGFLAGTLTRPQAATTTTATAPAPPETSEPGSAPLVATPRPASKSPSQPLTVVQPVQVGLGAFDLGGSFVRPIGEAPRVAQREATPS